MSEELDSSIERLLRGLIRGTKAYGSAVCCLLFIPWRAATALSGDRQVMGRAVTFLFASSFLVSLVDGAVVDLFRHTDPFAFSSLPELRKIAATSLTGAMRSELPEAIASTLPGLLCAEWFAYALGRLLSNGDRLRVKRLALLSFVAHGLVLAVAIASLLGLLDRLAEAVLRPLGEQDRTITDQLVILWAYFVLLGLPILLALNFAVVVWPRRKRGVSDAGQVNRSFKTKLRAAVAIVAYPVMLSFFVVSIALPHAIIATLTPLEPTDATIRWNVELLIKNVGMPVVLESHLKDTMTVSQTGFSLRIFGENGKELVQVPGSIVEWESGEAAVLTVPPGTSRWARVIFNLGDDFCKKVKVKVTFARALRAEIVITDELSYATHTSEQQGYVAKWNCSG